MAILIKGWILPIGGVASGRVCTEGLVINYLTQWVISFGLPKIRRVPQIAVTFVPDILQFHHLKWEIFHLKWDIIHVKWETIHVKWENIHVKWENIHVKWEMTQPPPPSRCVSTLGPLHPTALSHNTSELYLRFPKEYLLAFCVAGSSKYIWHTILDCPTPLKQDQGDQCRSPGVWFWFRFGFFGDF